MSLSWRRDLLFALSNKKQIPRTRKPGARNDNSAIPWLLFTLHGIEASAVKLQEMSGIFLCCFGQRAALETHSRRPRLAIAGRDGDELHQIECNVLVAPQAHTAANCFFHEVLILLRPHRRRNHSKASPSASGQRPSAPTRGTGERATDSQERGWNGLTHRRRRDKPARRCIRGSPCPARSPPARPANPGYADAE